MKLNNAVEEKNIGYVATINDYVYIIKDKNGSFLNSIIHKDFFKYRII